MSLDQLDEFPVRAVYLQRNVGDSIVLPSAAIELISEDNRVIGTGQPILTLTPDLRLRLKLACQTPTVEQALEDRARRNRHVPTTIRIGDAHTLGASWFRSGYEEDGYYYESNTSMVTATPPTSRIRSLILHIANFPMFMGPNDFVLRMPGPHGGGWRRIGRIALVAEGWETTITEVESAEEMSKELRMRGGYAITHVAKIVRSDGAEFSTSNAEELVSLLQRYLSFSVGREIGIACPVGFNAGHEPVFAQWGMTRADSGSWQPASSWFDSHHSEQLAEVFPGFAAIIADPAWSRAFRECHYFTLAANRGGSGGGMDIGTILAQVAMERLAWTSFVLVKRSHTETSYKKCFPHANDQIRGLAEALAVPLSVPESLPALSSICETSGIDAAQAICRLRNDLVHPKPKHPRLDGEIFDAWRFSMHLLDLFLLRLCGHKGYFANRLKKRWAGTVERVPWASSEDEPADADAG